MKPPRWVVLKHSIVLLLKSCVSSDQIYSELEAIVDKLATESQRGSNTLRKQTSKSLFLILYDIW